jgi:hypothetical protein
MSVARASRSGRGVPCGGDGELGDDRPLRDGQTGDAARHHSRRSRSHTLATVSVRYVVDDVDDAIAFYCRYLGFEERMHPAPTFATVTLGHLRLLLSAGARPCPTGPCRHREDGTAPRSRSTT